MVAPDCIQLLHESALEQLREAILAGDIRPGSKLVQEELAQRFHMSRIPLREALRTLEGEGLVVSFPRRGVICRPLEAKDIDDLYTLRLALERLAVKAAASSYSDLRSKTAERGKAARKLVSRGEHVALFYLDRDFHDDIAVASGNAHVTRTLSQSWSQIMRAMHYHFALESYPQKVWQEHEAIARAIATGDPDRAERLIETHINTSREMILRGLREHAL